MSVFERMTSGLAKSREKFKESMNVLLGRGPELDEGFWDDLEETLILSDIGGAASMDIVESLREKSTRLALPDAYAVLDLLSDEIQGTFASGGDEVLGGDEAIVLFVGINGTGKTTTVGKIANEAAKAGRKVILGSADTFRAAAIEQLEIWAQRADVPVVTRERGSDPASVCFETIERAEEVGADLVLIDTAGRLHTSDDLMRELEKVVAVTKKRANVPVYTVLVIDATTGQNGLQQAREFDRALHLDALIVTKLDGSAKGGISLAISHELGLPIIKIGVGESIDDLRDFDPSQFVRALIGDFEEADLVEDAPEDAALESAPEGEAAPAAPCAEGQPHSDAGADGGSTELQPRSEGVDVLRKAASIQEGADASLADEAPKMSWAEFVEMDDARKAAEPAKKHFWEKW